MADTLRPDPNRKRWHFDGTITAGNMLTVAAVVVSMVSAVFVSYSALKQNDMAQEFALSALASRVTIVEAQLTPLAEQANRITRIETQINFMSSILTRMEDKIDLIDARP